MKRLLMLIPLVSLCCLGCKQGVEAGQKPATDVEKDDQNIGALWPVVNEDGEETQPQLSPDERWIAYCSTESGHAEVYVRPFPDVNKAKWHVSTKGGSTPRWAPNGRELFYRNGEEMMVVRIETEPTFKLGTPRKINIIPNWFEELKEKVPVG